MLEWRHKLSLKAQFLEMPEVYYGMVNETRDGGLQSQRFWRPMTLHSSASLQLSFPWFDHSLRNVDLPRPLLPTNITANRHAVHRWFNFIAGFAPEFVAQQCPQFPGGLLLDPFAGCGTSLVVAQSLGHRAIGFEPHPFFARISRAKTAAPISVARLQNIEETLLAGLQTPRQTSMLTSDAATFLVKLFEEHTLHQLLGAQAALEDAQLHDDDLAFLVLSRVLDMCSTAATDGIYKAPTSTKKPYEPTRAVRKVVEQVRHDMANVNQEASGTSVVVHERSSEDMKGVENSIVDVVVTSPPYLNNFDFAEMTRMYLYFWGICGSWRAISQEVRAKLIVNTTTALAGHRDLQVQYRGELSPCVLPDLDRVVSSLAETRRLRARTKEYDLLVYPYFAQMTRVLREVQRCLVPGGAAHFIVADAAFYGIHISTPQFLAAAMSDLGFVDVQCIKLRDRGQRWLLEKRDGSPTGLGEYHIVAKRGKATW